MFGNVDNSGDLDIDYLDEVLYFIQWLAFILILILLWFYVPYLKYIPLTVCILHLKL